MTTRAPIILPPPLLLLGLQGHWCVWKWITKNGRRTKPPYRGDDPNTLASSTDPASWCSFDTAMLAYTEAKCDGVGFCLIPEPEPWPDPVDGAELLDGIAI